jgi:ATP-dependent HslUV protease subunit HslV
MNTMHSPQSLYGTTILGLSRDGKAALGSDGQVTVGDTALKHSANKIRRLNDGEVLVGFAGAVADSLTLLERFESQLSKYPGRIERAAVELAKEWRTDRALSRLDATLAIVDCHKALLVAGSGEVIEPEDGIVAAGSGGAYALSGARALVRHTKLPLREIVSEGLKLASEICIYTNDHFTIEVIE